MKVSTKQYWIMIGCAALALCLLASNVWLYTQNRAAAGELDQRQLYVQQTVQREVLYQDIAKALAEMAMRSNDTGLTAMLAAQGIKFNPAKPAAVTKEAR